LSWRWRIGLPHDNHRPDSALTSPASGEALLFLEMYHLRPVLADWLNKILKLTAHKNVLDDATTGTETVRRNSRAGTKK
jgi:hypothetical protein